MDKSDVNRNNDWHPEDKKIKGKLDMLAPNSTPPAQVARIKLDSRIAIKEVSMRQKIFGARFRTAWAALVILAMIALSLSIPQVRVIANSFLGLFRVEQIEAVGVGIRMDNLPNELETRFTALDNVIADQITVDHEVAPVLVQDIADASQLAGFQARMPTRPQGDTVIYYQDASTVRLVIDRERWQILLDGMGYDDFILPESADGEEIKFNLPKAVIVGIGDCQYNEINEVKPGSPETKNCTILMQSDIPTIDAPAGIDINQAGQILLQALGMSEADAEAFSKTVNWATTLVVPVPSDIEYRHITIEGEDAIFLEDRYDGGKGVYTLLWVKDGLLHALIGDGTLTDALQSVGSFE
jgi:hypothetical protein